jgi:hypothetical protein
LEFWAEAWAKHLIHVEWQQLGGEPSFNPVPQVAEMRRLRTFPVSLLTAAGQKQAGGLTGSPIPTIIKSVD